MLSTVSRRLFRKTLHRSENGYVLLTAIVFMLAASLVITSSLTFASSPLKQGTMVEDRTSHLYASAGIETAWQNISTREC